MSSGRRAEARLLHLGRQLENSLAYLSIFLLAFLPLLEIVARKFFRSSVPNSSVYIQHLVLIGTFLAAAITSRKKKHLSLALEIPFKEPLKSIIKTVVAVLCASIVMAFSLTSLSFIASAFEAAEKIGPIPKRLVVLVMFIGFSLMSVRFITGLGKNRRRILWLGLSWLAAAFLASDSLVQILGRLHGGWLPFLNSIGDRLQPILAQTTAPLIVFLLVSAFFGAPIFVVLGGIAYFLFARTGQPLEIIPNQAYSVLISHSIPAIPLFAVVGFFLSESKAGERLVKFFKSIFSWFPGGLAIMAVLVCAFFTTFTGASGVTILALGGLLFYILVQGGYPRKFSIGLLTASGSVGLLFPPSLPVIIYGVTAQVSIKDMFVGGLIPGAALVLAMGIIGILFSVKCKIKRHPVQFGQAASAFGRSLWEIMLPVLIAVLYFGGITNLQESAAFALIYTWAVETFVKKDLKLRDISAVLSKCVPIIGGVLIILALANGLSYYIIDAQIPMKLAAWTESAISSKYVFLLLLNLALIVVGCFMDIYSAILVVVPLIIPLAGLFHIHPVHLGIIFLANLELGYLTPPVGLNLFLASYRFEEPMAKVYRDVLLFIGVRLATVLLITYVPFLTTVLLSK
jgi:C4-dicarboxylate transporter DctM subunit